MKEERKAYSFFSVINCPDTLALLSGAGVSMRDSSLTMYILDSFTLRELPSSLWPPSSSAASFSSSSGAVLGLSV